MIVRTNDVSHRAYVGVVEECHNSSFPSSPDLLGLVCPFPFSVVMVFVG